MRKLAYPVFFKMDVGATANKRLDDRKHSSLKFMMITNTIEYYRNQPVWLALFRPYTKYYK